MFNFQQLLDQYILNPSDVCLKLIMDASDCLRYDSDTGLLQGSMDIKVPSTALPSITTAPYLQAVVGFQHSNLYHN
jgi:hypothetical protein